MILIKDIQDLLLALSAAFAENKTEKASKGTEFNIFHVLRVEAKEVIICRFLGELLKPDGNHGLGHLPLWRFVNTVLDVKDFDENDAKAARVELEDKIDHDRRVDIVIYSKRGVFPVEVKVWAGDQDAQLSDYYAYYRKYYQCEKIYYLTPSGWKPSEKSRQALTDKQIVCIAFSQEIYCWLDNVLKEFDLHPNIAMCIKQFCEVIQKMCAESRELEQIKEVLGLNGGFHAADPEQLHTAITFLKYRDNIFETIMQNYLLEYLAYDKEQYAVDFYNADDRRNVDNHVLLRVVSKKHDKAIAWICVATNIYLVAKNVKSPKDKTLWAETSSEEKSYFWQYIIPEKHKGKAFPLKSLDKFPEEKIAIDKYLADCMPE